MNNSVSKFISDYIDNFGSEPSYAQVVDIAVKEKDQQITKLTRQVEILKKALEQYAVQYEFKDDGPDYFIAKSALQKCEQIK